jgi:hypothetical protein
MVGRDDVVIEKPEVTVRVSYPLRGRFFDYAARGRPRGRLPPRRAGPQDLRLYHRIYASRASQGRYGVYGHDIGDLDLCGVCYDAARDVYTLEVDS